MVRAVEVRLSNGKPVKGLLKRARVYEDKHLPLFDQHTVCLPVREVPSKLLREVRAMAPEARLVDKELRVNRRTRSFRRELQKILPKEVYDEAARAYEQVGDVGIITVFDSMVPFEEDIAQALLDTNKGLRLVLKKAGRHEGDDRTPRYEVLAGEGSSRTVHKESGVELVVDVQEAYFSSRTFEERRRVSQLVRPDERVLVAFSGIAPYVCVLASENPSAQVLGVEFNEQAHEFALANVKRNDLANARVVCADVRSYSKACGEVFDRIVMPHPTEADYFLGDVLQVAASSCTVHLYLFSREDKLGEVRARLSSIAREAGFVARSVEVVEQFHVSPKVFKYCFDISLVRR